MENISAAEYAAANAMDAQQLAKKALDKTQSTEKLLDEIHTVVLAILLSQVGEKEAKLWIQDAVDLKNERSL